MHRLFGMLLLIGTWATPAFADGLLDGLWVGIYSPGPAFTDADSVPFSVVLETHGSSVSGRLIEVQTFGKEPATGLGAQLSGTISNDIVSLIKTYDGSGGVNHTVHLQLVFDAGDPDATELTEGDMLDGEWRIDASTKGQVRLFRLK